MTRDLSQEILQLQQIVKKLRSPDGCPWDKEQTSESLIPYLLEETYEVIDAIKEEQWDDLKSELGDLMLHIVFQADIAEGKSLFSLEDALRSINEKLLRRHPHVFSESEKNETLSKEAVLDNWEKLKMAEGRTSVLEGVPKHAASLLKAQRIQEKASKVGFDWDEVAPAMDKVDEELAELKEAWESADTEHIEEELGDLLFATVNVSRLMNLNAELTLRKAVEKFQTRFQAMEQIFKAKNWDINTATLEEMDKVWDEVKLVLRDQKRINKNK
jgi:tetrapyrrole methylase family protein / MazG family protein